MARHLFTIALALAAFSGAPAAAQPTPDDVQIAVVVTVKTPAGVTPAMLDAGFAAAVPQYSRLPGLIRKYFTRDATSFGGMYLWTNRKAADAWFSPEWRAGVKQRYGAEPVVQYFEVPVVAEMAQK